MNKIIKWFGNLSGMVLVILSGQVFSADFSNHQYSLRNTMYLCESTTDTDKTKMIYLLSPGQFLEHSGLPLPAISQYQQQKKYWQEWKTAQDGSKDRIIAIVDKGTAFSVKQYKTSPQNDYAVVTISFSSGPFAGRNVLFSEHELTLSQLS